MKTTFKTNCMSFEIEEISKLIVAYQTNKAETPNYLIMSEDTQELLKADCERFLTAKQKLAVKGWMIDRKCTSSQCYGIDVAICNKLKLGEVEVV